MRANVGSTPRDTSALQSAMLAALLAFLPAVLVLEMLADATPASSIPLGTALTAGELAMAVVADCAAMAVFACKAEAVVRASRLVLAVLALKTAGSSPGLRSQVHRPSGTCAP